MLTRYWIKFADESAMGMEHLLHFGVGVTAYDLDDAMKIMSRSLFNGEAVPEIIEIIENIDVSTLDEGHVLPNTRNPVCRGVWYPML